jgi:hypothetical protein
MPLKIAHEPHPLLYVSSMTKLSFVFVAFTLSFLSGCTKSLTENDLAAYIEPSRIEIQNALNNSVRKVEKGVADFGNREMDVKSLDSLLALQRFFITVSDSILSDSSADHNSTNNTLRILSSKALSRVSSIEQKRFFSIIDSSEFFEITENSIKLRESDLDNFRILQQYLRLEWVLLCFEYVQHAPQNRIVYKSKYPTALQTNIIASAQKDSVHLNITPFNSITSVETIWIDGKTLKPQQGIVLVPLDTKSHSTQPYTRKKMEIKIPSPIYRYDSTFSTSAEYTLKNCNAK